jgi:Dihydroorotase
MCGWLYTGEISTQLYAEAFEAAGADLADADMADAFTRFLSTNGPALCNSPMSGKHFTFERTPQTVLLTSIPGGDPG